MARVSIEDLADIINLDCENYRYYWAYGLVRETLTLWRDPKHRTLLCSTAQIMVDQQEEIQRTRGGSNR